MFTCQTGGGLPESVLKNTPLNITECRLNFLLFDKTPVLHDGILSSSSQKLYFLCLLVTSKYNMLIPSPLSKITQLIFVLQAPYPLLYGFCGRVDEGGGI